MRMKPPFSCLKKKVNEFWLARNYYSLALVLRKERCSIASGAEALFWLL